MPALRSGVYDLEVEVEYVERIDVGNQFSCGLTANRVSGGCAAKALTKSVRSRVTGVYVSGNSSRDILLPAPVVLVHGIYSCYDKWYRDGDDPEARKHWDNYLRSVGFLTMTPNYYFHVDRSHPWEAGASQVREHVARTLESLTSGASSERFPPWHYIGHSQGGLIARVLASGNRFIGDSLVRSLAKIYLLGTPNSGGRGVLFGANATAALACFSYLGPTTTQGVFNRTYKDFGGKPVLAFAGTYSCGPMFWSRPGNLLDCENVPRGDDGVVDVNSVRTISMGRGTGIALETQQVFFSHEQLGSPESRMEVLVRKIIPDIEVARPNAPSNPDGGGGPSGSADVLRGDTWASVNPGQTVRGVRFASDNKTISVLGARIGGFVGAVVPNFPRTVFVSPSSRAGGLVLITLWDDSYGCADAVVVDRAGAVKARGIVPKRWRVWREWVSWSPNEHYALLAAAGEVTMGDMVLVDVRTGKSLELHFRDLTGNRPGSDELVQEFEFENVEWIGPNRFRVRLDVHCNPYNGGACTDGRWEIVLRSYTATVELPSQRISYVPAANATPATPPKVTVRVYNVDDRAVVSVNGVDLQTVPFKGTSLFDVSNLLRSGSNTIRLRLLNDWQDYSYGFEVRRDAQTIFREECGQADVKGCFGSDTRAPKGVVYDKSVSVYVP